RGQGAHRDARSPVLRQAGEGSADLAETGLPEHRRGAVESEVVVQPGGVRTRIGLHRGRAVLRGVLPGAPDERDRDALAAMAPPHGEARDHPDVDVVDARCGARDVDPREVEPWPERDPADGLAVAVRDEAGRLPPARQARERGASRRFALAGEAALALLLRGEAWKEIPAGRAPGPRGHGLHVIDTCGRERPDR